MEKFDQEYPPNITGMDEENYKHGVDILYSLIRTDEKTKDTPGQDHIEKVLSRRGVDAALYLLYYGHRVKEEIYGTSINEAQMQKEFKTLLQTAVSIGAMVSREHLLILDKLDSIWNISYEEGAKDV